MSTDAERRANELRNEVWRQQDSGGIPSHCDEDGELVVAVVNHILDNAGTPLEFLKGEDIVQIK